MDIIQLNRFNKKKRERVRLALRNNNILPPYGQELNAEQRVIDKRISDNDFTVLDELKEVGKITKPVSIRNNKKRIHKESERPVLKRSRMLWQLRDIGILPPLGQEHNEEQQSIVNHVMVNYETPIKSYISSYSHLISPEFRMWYKTKNYCKKFKYRHKVFEIEPSDIIIPKYCPYLGLELSTNPNDRNKPYYYSIDRIDSKLGYVKGNVQIISKKANTMKTNATVEELLLFAKNVITLYS
jgi:hypothetical protein